MVFDGVLPSSSRYQAKASPGLQVWTNVPWLAIFDILITTTAQSGYYPTFLFKADMSGVYFNLNQGVTDIKDRYKAKSKDVLVVRAADFLAQLGQVPEGFKIGKIDLGEGLSSSVELYNYGSIFHKFYPKDSFPTDEEILKDLRLMLDAYSSLVSNDINFGNAEGDESPAFTEDTRRLVTHTRIERNQKLVKEVKKQKGYQCEACGFDFEKTYGEVGKSYIEAHHLIPISKLKKETVELDPQSDFAVLCANCHRMIHRLEDTSDISELKKILA